MRKACRGVPDQCQSGVEVEPDALPAEVRGGSLDVSSQEVARRRMYDGIHGLREIDNHGRLAPPQHVERREVTVHELSVQDRPDLALQVPPDSPRREEVEVDVGQPRSRAVSISYECHPIAILDSFNGWRRRHPGGMQAPECGPLVRLPPCLKELLAEACPLLDRARFVARAFAPDAGVQIVVAEAALEPRFEAFLGHEACARGTGA